MLTVHERRQAEHACYRYENTILVPMSEGCQFGPSFALSNVLALRWN